MSGVEFPSSRFTFLRAARGAELPAHVRRAGERDQLDPRVVDQDVADLARPSDDDVQPPGRLSGVGERLRQEERRERRRRRGLEDARAAGGERRPDLVRHQVQREVERRDRPDDADRPAHDHARRGPRRPGARPSRSARRRAPRASCAEKMIVCTARSASTCAVAMGFPASCEIVRASSSRRSRRSPATRSSTAARSCAGTGVSIASRGGVDRPLGVGAAAVGHLRHDAAVERRGHVERLARLVPLASDQDLANRLGRRRHLYATPSSTLRMSPMRSENRAFSR